MSQLQHTKKSHSTFFMTLKLFSNITHLSGVQRNLLTDVLQTFRDSLPPAALALLDERFLEWEPYLEGWAAQFRAPRDFGAPLLQALRQIDTLARPENDALRQEALSRVPDGWIILAFNLKTPFSRHHHVTGVKP